MPELGVALSAPGDVSAFCALEFPRLVGALDLYLGDLAVAQEIAQEALIRAASNWERVGKLESPGGWTRRVAMNMATSHLRRRLAERRARVRLLSLRLPAEEPTDEYEDVRAAVVGLPDKQRRAVVMRYFLDLSTADTAAAMRCSEEAVRALTSRAGARLRGQLQPLHDRGVRDA